MRRRRRRRVQVASNPVCFPESERGLIGQDVDQRRPVCICSRCRLRSNCLNNGERDKCLQCVNALATPLDSCKTLLFAVLLQAAAWCLERSFACRAGEFVCSFACLLVCSFGSSPSPFQSLETTETDEAQKSLESTGTVSLRRQLATLASGLRTSSQVAGGSSCCATSARSQKPKQQLNTTQI